MNRKGIRMNSWEFLSILCIARLLKGAMDLSKAAAAVEETNVEARVPWFQTTRKPIEVQSDELLGII